MGYCCKPQLCAVIPVLLCPIPSLYCLSLCDGVYKSHTSMEGSKKLLWAGMPLCICKSCQERRQSQKEGNSSQTWVTLGKEQTAEPLQPWRDDWQSAEAMPLQKEGAGPLSRRGERTDTYTSILVDSEVDSDTPSAPSETSEPHILEGAAHRFLFSFLLFNTALSIPCFRSGLFVLPLHLSFKLCPFLPLQYFSDG